MNDQISMFELLGMDETPEIPVEQQKKGVKGWVIETNCLFTVENGFSRNAVGVTTAKVILKQDTRKDKFGICQHAEVCEDGCRGDGWIGYCRKLYAVRPTWRELVEYARERYKEPWDVIFVMKNGDAIIRVCDFDTKKPIDDYFRR